MAERLDIVVTERGARRVRRNIDRIGASATATGGAVKLLRRSLGLLGGVLILGTAVKTLKDFGQAMSTVKAISQATEGQFKQLRDTAKQLGATTRFSATQAAEGMIFLARAGFEANEVVSAIGPTLLLAQAGALDLGRAADIASNVLKGFGLTAAETTRIVDVLALTANSANTNVEQLGNAMSFAAPAAKSLGVSVETTAAAIGALSDAGVQSTRAGTALRQIFTKLIKPTAAGGKALKNLGLTVADVDVGTRGLIPVLQSLKDANLQLADAAGLVGVRQATQLLILKDSIPTVKRLTEANKNAAGTARRVADIMDDNLNGALFAVKSAFEAVIIAMGDLGADQALTKFLRGLASALRFAARNIDDVVAALKVLVAPFLIPKLIRLILGLTTAMLTNPVTAFATALLLVVSAATLLRDSIILAEDSAVTLGDAMAGAATVIGTTLTDAVNAMGGTFENFSELTDKALVFAGRGLVVLLATANGVVRAMIASFEDFPQALKELAVRAWNGFLFVMEGALNIFVLAINEALEFLGLSAKKLEFFDLSILKTDGEQAGSILADAFKKGFNDVMSAGIGARNLRRGLESDEARDSGGTGIRTSGGGGGAGGGPSTGGSNAFGTLLSDLRQEGELLKLSNAQRAVREAQLVIEDELKRDLTETEKELVRVIVSNNEQLQVQRNILDQIHGPLEAYETGLAAINALLATNAITTGEAATATRDLRIAFLETQTDLVSGFERGFLKIGREVEDFASLAESSITNAFKGAEDALVQFVTTGKLEFKDLVNSILTDLARMAIRKSIIEPLFNILSTVGASLLTGGAGGVNGFGVLSTGPSGATGGLLQGGGGSTTDNIPVRLSNGEFVVNASSSKQFLPLLNAINNFSPGGGSGGGGGVTVQIIDKRGADAPPLEEKQTNGPDGRRILQITIRDIVRRQITSGEHDQSLNQRFGLNPALRSR